MPYLQQGSRNSAHHAVQKPVSRYFEIRVAVARFVRPARLVQGANTVLRLRLRTAERIEIVFAEDRIGSGLHEREIRLRSDMYAHMSIEGAKPGCDVVAVAPEAGIVAGMKAIGSNGECADSYSVGEKTVQGSKKAANMYRGIPWESIGKKVCDLPPGVYAGVGASCPDNACRGAQGFCKRLFERGLHRRPARLDLPSGKRRAVVFYRHAVYRHSVRVASTDIVFCTRRMGRPASRPGICLRGRSVSLPLPVGTPCNCAGERFPTDNLHTAGYSPGISPMTVPTRIYLTGFMGSGKSTLGPRLADRLGYDFVDLDRDIERAVGGTVQAIFANRGEEAFRRLETERLRAVSHADRMVIALGGGAVTREENLHFTKAQGRLIYLRMTPRHLADRLEKRAASRPMLHEEGRPLSGASLRKRIAALLAQRESFYEQADIVLDVGKRSLESAVSMAMEALENKSGT